MSRLSLLLLLLLIIIITFLHLLLPPISSLPSTPQGLLKEDKIRLGSTPPSCRRRCNDCRPCMAVQVPTMPGKLTETIGDASHRSYPNYKPLGWKCRCGDRFFNP